MWILDLTNKYDIVLKMVKGNSLLFILFHTLQKTCLYTLLETLSVLEISNFSIWGCFNFLLVHS